MLLMLSLQSFSNEQEIDINKTTSLLLPTVSSSSSSSSTSHSKRKTSHSLKASVAVSTVRKFVLLLRVAAVTLFLASAKTPAVAARGAGTTGGRRNSAAAAAAGTSWTSSSPSFSLSLSPLAFLNASRFSSDKIKGNEVTMSSSPNEEADDAVATRVKDTLLNRCPTIKLRNGLEHPAIGFGTYKVGFIPASASSAAAASSAGGGTGEPNKKERTAEECVSDALDVGYRFLECAEFYGNEEQVGNAIQKSGVDRKDLFLCSKVWTTTIERGPEAVRERFELTLKNLRTDYMDLYLIHWPVPGHHVQAYKVLQDLYNEGKVRGIGLSNYALEDYEELKADPEITVLPVVNQIEINPFLFRRNTLNKFERDGVVLQSYRSLRDGKAFDHPTLTEMAKKYEGKSTAQILGRWCVQHGYVYVPKSVRKHRMVENADVFDFALSEEDMKTLDETLTTPEALETYQQLYRKCVNRDTSKDGTMDGVKMKITID